MSAIMIQAVFYGKSQFGVKEKVRLRSVLLHLSSSFLQFSALATPRSPFTPP